MTVARQELAIRELAKRYPAGTFGHFLMLITGWVIAPNALPFSYAIPASVFAALIPLRMYARRNALDHSEQRRLNWTLLAIGTFGCNLLWGVVVACVQAWSGASIDTVVFAFFTCGISIGSVVALAPSRWLQFGALGLMIVPAIVSGVLGYGLGAFAVLHAIFLAYTLVMGTAASRDFWQTVASTEQLHHQEVELRQAQKLEAVGRLASGIAHEINTPVQFISDSCTFLAEGIAEVDAGIAGYRALVADLTAGRVSGGDADARAARLETEHDLAYMSENLSEAVERALAGLGRVTQIVHAMRDFARHAHDKAPANLNAALESTLVICHHETGGVADVVTDLGPIPLVTCHGGELNQVFLNIIVNAAHAIGSRPGSERKRGTIGIRTWAPDDRWVHIAISDTGGGIPPAIIDKIFDPFFTTKEVGKGSGQGLAIARSIVVGKHGGRLAVESTPGIGTTFTIALPTKPENPPAQRMLHSA